MATSKKINKAAAQSIKELCESCDDKEEGEFYCVNCEQVLCDRCKQMHKKNKRLKDDKIIDLINAMFRKEIKSVNDTCNDHPGREKVFYCFDCKMEVCSFCTSSTHAGHTCKHMEYLAVEIKSSFPENLHHLKSLLSNFCVHEKQIQTSYDENIATVESLGLEIIQRYNDIVLIAKAAHDQQIKQLQKLKSEVIGGHKSAISAFKAKITDIQSIIHHVERDLNYLPSKTVINLHKELTAIREESGILPEINIPKIPSYHKHPLESDRISGMVGTVVSDIDIGAQQIDIDVSTVVKVAHLFHDSDETNKDKNMQPARIAEVPKHTKKKKVQLKNETELKVVEQPKRHHLTMSMIRTRHNEIIGIILPSRGGKYLWCAHHKDTFLTRLSMDGEELRTSKDIGGKLIDAVLTSNEEVLCTAIGLHSIKRVQRVGTVKCFCSIGQYVANGLCITDADDIYVCLALRHDNVTTDVNISKFDRKGHIIQTIEYKHGLTTAVLAPPSRIARDRTGRLYILDGWDPGNKLICFDMKSGVVYTWPSKRLLALYGNIRLTSVACSATSNGKVYVCDNYNNKVYEVLGNGHKYDVVFDDRQACPNTIRFDEHDQLLIGCKGRIYTRALDISD